MERDDESTVLVFSICQVLHVIFLVTNNILYGLVVLAGRAPRSTLRVLEFGVALFSKGAHSLLLVFLFSLRKELGKQGVSFSGNISDIIRRYEPWQK